MPAAGDFLSCDWGTTSFRLRWVSGADGSVLREIREPVGVRGLYEEAMRQGAGSHEARGEVFAGFLGRKLEEIKVERIDKSMPPPLGLRPPRTGPVARGMSVHLDVTFLPTELACRGKVA